MRRLLLTNDDGFYAPGLQTLYRELSKTDYEIYIVAPESQRSATGHSITLFEPIFVQEIELEGENIGYSIRGTPADCVKLAVQGRLVPEPDLVISGINNGPNLGTDVFYSGTVSAAMEGNLLGIPALAVSLANFKAKDYEGAARCTIKIIAEMFELKEQGLINLNIPDLPEEEWKGVKITSLGKSHYENVFERRKDPLGRCYFWQGGTLLPDDGEGTDWQAIRSGYVSLTPMHSSLTDFDRLKHWEKTLKTGNSEH